MMTAGPCCDSSKVDLLDGFTVFAGVDTLGIVSHVTDEFLRTQTHFPTVAVLVRIHTQHPVILRWDSFFLS